MSAAELPAEIHVQSLRLASGSEALVARVVERDGAAGFGFTLDLEAHVARELAGWDARARREGVSLAALLGAVPRTVAIERDAQTPFAPDWDALDAAIRERRLKRLAIDPWAWGGIAPAQRAAALAAQAGIEIALVAPHSHPWEIAVCAALAAASPGRAWVAAHAADRTSATPLQAPGLGVDWALEPGFAALLW